MELRSALFPALLRYWRQRRGLSQLDLALSAGVSARHVSFLETGRAQPSQEMILLLTATLRLPLRDRNQLLQAAGFAAAYAEPDPREGLTQPVRHALERMLAQHEPFPMTIMDRHYNVLQLNRGAARLLGRFVAEPAALRSPANVYHLLFDPRLGRPFVVEWEQTARVLLSRLHVEALEHPSDDGLRSLIDELLALPGVPETWRQPDFSQRVDSTAPLRLRRDSLELGFLTAITCFSAPSNVTLEELRIESYFPLDAATERACAEGA